MYILKEVAEQTLFRRDYTLFQLWTFSWMNGLFKKGSKDPLEMDDIPPLPQSCSVAIFEQEIMVGKKMIIPM